MPETRLNLGDTGWHRAPDLLNNSQKTTIERMSSLFLANHPFEGGWSIAYDFRDHGGHRDKDVTVILVSSDYVAFLTVDVYGNGRDMFYEHQLTPVHGDFDGVEDDFIDAECEQ